MENWYYTHGGAQAGPVSSEQLQQLVAAGEVLPTDNVWKDGMAAWAPVGSVPGLVAGAQGAVAPSRAAQVLEAPAQLAYATPASVSGAGMLATARSLEMLRQTKPWVRLISIVLLVGAGLMLVVGLISAVMSGTGPPGNFVQIGAIVFVACLYGAMAYYLSQYASAIGRVVKTRRESDLEAALGSQKSFWKFSGILTLVVIALYGLIFIFAIALGGMRLFR